jgi:hypothetical protein
MIAPITFEQTCPEDAEQRNHCNEELVAMHLPEMAQFLGLQQTGDGHEHDRREHGLRQIPAPISASPAAMTFLGPILGASFPTTGANAAAATIRGISLRIAEIGLTFCTVCRK